MIDLFIGSHESTLEVNFKYALELCCSCRIMHGLRVSHSACSSSTVLATFWVLERWFRVKIYN